MIDMKQQLSFSILLAHFCEKKQHLLTAKSLQNALMRYVGHAIDYKRKLGKNVREKKSRWIWKKLRVPSWL